MFPTSEAPPRSDYTNALGDLDLELAKIESIGTNAQSSPSSHVCMQAKSHMQIKVCGPAVMRNRLVDNACP